MIKFLPYKTLKYLSPVLWVGILAVYFSACDRESPCDTQLCTNGDCILAVDSVATVEGLIVQTSDTLTQSFRILADEGTFVHRENTLILASSIVLAPNVEISKVSSTTDPNVSINILTYPTCDCFTGWEGSQCDEPAPCDGRNCLNGGAAVEIDESTCECDCPVGFTGDLCETADPCALVNCLNNSHCEVNQETGEGECVCDTGYEPTSCFVQIRNKFIGEYTVVLDSCSTFRIPASIEEEYIISVVNDSEDIEKIILDSSHSFGAIPAKTKIDSTLEIQHTTDQMELVESLESTFENIGGVRTIDLLLKITYPNGGMDTCKVILQN